MNQNLVFSSKAVVYLSLLLIFSSCNCNRHLKNQLTAFEKETIALPQRVLKVENGKSGISTIQPEGKTLVIFFAPKECTSCALSHLKQSESVLEMFDSSPAASVVVFQRRVSAFRFMLISRDVFWIIRFQKTSASIHSCWMKMGIR